MYWYGLSKFNLHFRRWCFLKIRLRFYGTINTIKVMSSQSVILLTLFLGRFRPTKRLTVNQYLVLILLPVTDNCPPWINGRGRMAEEIISWPISTKVMCPGWGSNSQPLDLQSDVLPTALLSLGCFLKNYLEHTGFYSAINHNLNMH